MNATTNLDNATSQPVALPLPGSSAGAGATAGPALPGVSGPAQPGLNDVQLDAFARRAGPDVAVATTAGLIRVHAVFQVDPTTRDMTVSVVDESGNLVRMIPSDSVARMIAAMAAYRGR